MVNRRITGQRSTRLQNPIQHAIPARMPASQVWGDKRENGGGEIRTHETLAGLPVFKTGPFNHSGTPPGGGEKVYSAAESRSKPEEGMLGELRGEALFIHFNNEFECERCK